MNVTIESYELEAITHNPFQPRLDEDNGHVLKIAISILQNGGLMQIPLGRPHPDQDGRVQLAFGHTRLAAFKLIRDVQNGYGWAKKQITHDPGTPMALLAELAVRAVDESRLYTTMPVQVRELSDEEMFRLGLGENIDRKDLSPLEIARAMRTYQVSFGKTSAEIGELFGGMSDSGVRNKMRLLDLPGVAQEWLHHGEITEGNARALLSLYKLPEEERMRAEDQEEAPKPSEIVEIARSGAKAEAVTALINRLAQWIETGSLPAPEILAAPVVEERPAYVLINEEALGVTRPSTAATEDSGDAEEAFEETSFEEPEEDAAEDTPAPAPVPQPAPQPAPQKAPQPPAPQPEPAKPLTFAESTITLTLTFWPESSNPLGRAVMVGGRVNQGLPVMRMFHEETLDMGETLGKLYNELEDQYDGGTK